MRHGFAALLFVFGPLAGAPAAADEVQVALHYEPSGRCPDAETFAELVAARLGRDPFVESAPDVVRVELGRRGRTRVGTLVWIRDGAPLGRRQLEARGSCVGLLESLAVALTILLEDPPGAPDATAPPPDDVAPEAAAEPAPRPPPEVPPARPPPTATAPNELPTPDPEAGAEASDRELAFVGELSGGTVLGVVPGPGLSVRAAVGLRVGNVDVRLEGVFDAQLGTKTIASRPATARPPRRRA